MSDEYDWKIVDRMTGSPRTGTKVLEVFSLSGLMGVIPADSVRVESRGETSEAGHAEKRKRVWDMLPGVFGLKG